MFEVAVESVGGQFGRETLTKGGTIVRYYGCATYATDVTFQQVCINSGSL